MIFNKSLPVRFRVLKSLGYQMYELAIESRHARSKPFRLKSVRALEVGASYMAAAGDGTFKDLALKQDFAYLNADVREILQLASEENYADMLLDALLNASTQADYELFKYMLMRLFQGEIYIAALDKNLPIKIQISANKIRCEHYILGVCELVANVLSTEFTCVQDLLLKLKND